MLELEHGFRVVDVHVELEPDERRRPRNAGDPESIEREMHQAGIVQSVVCSGDREGGYLKANNGVARLGVERPFVAVARVNGVRAAGTAPTDRLRNLASRRGEEHTSPGDVEQYAYDDRFAGFKLHPRVDGLPDEAVLERLANVGLPVLTSAGPAFPPSAVEAELLAYDFPLVVSLFGGHLLDEELVSSAIELLDRHDDCYLDTGHLRDRDALERAVMEHPDRILFGSGAPAWHPNVAIMEILTLDVPEDAMRKVFSNNPGRVIEELSP